MKKKLITTLLIFSLILSATTTAYATEITASGDGTVPVDLTVETPIFSVTVPTSLPITLTETGDIVVASNATIINGSAGPIKITSVQTKGINGWTTVDFTDFDIASAKVGSKNVGLTLTMNTTTVQTTGADTNDFIGSITLIKGQSLPLTYDAVVPTQKTAQTGTQVAEVIYTVGWDD
jgi:hypothetical protein